MQGLDFEHDCSSCSNLLAELPNLQSVLLDLFEASWGSLHLLVPRASRPP